MVDDEFVRWDGDRGEGRMGGGEGGVEAVFVLMLAMLRMLGWEGGGETILLRWA